MGLGAKKPEGTFKVKIDLIIATWVYLFVKTLVYL